VTDFMGNGWHEAPLADASPTLVPPRRWWPDLTGS